MLCCGNLFSQYDFEEITVLLNNTIGFTIARTVTIGFDKKKKRV